MRIFLILFLSIITLEAASSSKSLKNPSIRFGFGSENVEVLDTAGKIFFVELSYFIVDGNETETSKTFTDFAYMTTLSDLTKYATTTTAGYTTSIETIGAYVGYIINISDGIVIRPKIGLTSTYASISNASRFDIAFAASLGYVSDDTEYFIMQSYIGMANVFAFGINFKF